MHNFRLLSAGLVALTATAVAATPPPGATSTPAPAASAAAPAASTALPPAPAGVTTLQTVDVTGVMPGPGLWKVTRGDHALWILGVVPTLPAGVRWQSDQVAQTIAASQTVIDAPDVKLKVDTNWLGKLFLLPTLYHAQRNPDGKTLKDVLPAPLYARWEAAKQRYFGDDRGIERYKPILAAAKLLRRALKENKLRGDSEITHAVVAMAKQHNVKLVKPQTTLEVHDPRQALKAFEASGPDGEACLGLVLDMLQHQLPDLRQRANAWATGDLATLRRIPQSAYRATCRSAITGAGFAKSLGIDNLPAREEGAWLGAADTALATNAQSFAVLPMHQLLDAHGYLAALQARGYSVTAPDADDPASGASAGAASSSALPAAASSAAPVAASSAR
ncbi:MAG TPA: TraB/GumN family protein [Rhodanobacteraceae bacterium]